MIRNALAWLLMASAALAGCHEAADADTAHDVASAAVSVVPARRGSLPRTLTAWGEVSPGPAFQQAVTFGVDGSLASLKVGQGERVSAGQVLGTFVYAASSRAALLQAQAAVHVAQVSLDRARRLRRDALATDEQVAQAAKALSDAQAALAPFPRDARAAAPVAVRAPVAGTVTSVAAAMGQVVPANGALIILSPSAGLTLVAGVEPGEVTGVRPGMPAVLVPATGGHGVPAQVVGVGDAIDPQTRLVPVRIHPHSELLAGSTWRADITLGDVDGWLAPAEAVVGEGASASVLQVHEGKAHRVPVSVLLQREGSVALEGGLNAADPVVTTGAPQLAEGMQVVINGGSR